MISLHVDWPVLVLIIICVVLIVLPTKYDPAIRWKERNERNRRK